MSETSSRGPSSVTIGPDRRLHVGGRPFFPIGARYAPDGAAPGVLADAGFNCLRWAPFGLGLADTPPFEVPADLGGLLFYPYLHDRGDLSQDAAARTEDLRRLTLAVRDHPALLCYEQRNEPAYTFRDQARPRSPVEGIVAGSRVVRELDPDHPIRLGHMDCNLVSTLRRYNPGADIVGCNPYVVSPPRHRPHIGCRPDGQLTDCPNQTLSAVGDYTTKMMRVAEGRPVWMQIQAMANEDWFNEQHTPENRGSTIHPHQRLFPSAWQMRFMAFNAIIRGATALELAMLRVRLDEGAWTEIRKVVGELRALHDALAAPSWPGVLDVDYTELGFSDWTGVETLVKAGAGQHWILAANTQSDPAEATFSGLPDGTGATLSVFGEQRSVAVSDGRLTDYFRPYEVHVYTDGPER